MLPSDMIQKKDSRGKTQNYVQMPSGKKYRLLSLFDAGGVGQVYLTQGKTDSGAIAKYVIKEYPKPKTPTEKAQQRNIRKNLMSLIKHPVLDKNQHPLASMVPPLEVISFINTGTFGYVMDYVDLSDYVSVGKMLRNYPDDMGIVCTMAKNISHFFQVLAGSAGCCYKDINEGNIYLNPKTGDVRIIDNDNVGDPSIKTISGTGFYMAPEVQTGKKDPDRQTDRFSLAAYLLRMFTGARPYEGKQVIEYCRQHNQNVYEAASVVFGSNAVFVFDPVNTSNSIRKYPIPVGLTREQEKERNGWKVRCDMWDHLPRRMQDAFIATFSDGIRMENVNQRTTALNWYQLFEKLEKTIITCPHCKKRTFGTVETCFYCKKAIPQVSCKSCGEKTPRDVRLCLHCGKDPKKAPEQTVICPHCNAKNDVRVRICKSCNHYITVTCQCGTVNSGTSKMCSRCGKALFKLCPNSSCKKQVAMTETRCPYCHEVFQTGPTRCQKCGYQIFPGETMCRQCHMPVDSGKPDLSKKPPTHRLRLDITILNAGSRQKASIEHDFPSGVVYCADHLCKGQGARPLFKLKCNKERNAYALQNMTGGTINYRTASGKIQTSTDKGFIPLEPNIQFQFGSGLVMKIDSLQHN